MILYPDWTFALHTVAVRHQCSMRLLRPQGINGEQQPRNPGPPPGFVKDFAGGVPLGHMGRDGVDLGGAALFLASPASDYVTGHTLTVDGGFSIWH